jgi:two-component sensor histidine kinase
MSNFAETTQMAFSPAGVLGELSFDVANPLWDLLPAAVYVCDRDGLILRYNCRAVELWGRAPTIGDPGQRFCGSLRMYRLDGGPLPHAECPMAEVLRTGRSVQDQEVMIERPDGSCVWVKNAVSAIRGSTGRVEYITTVCIDITERKQAEERQNLLVRELNHRVKNLFAITSSVVALSARSASTPQDMAATLRGRLDALARAHELVIPDLTGTADGHREGATFDALVRAICSPHFDSENPERIVVAGPAVTIGGKAATSVSLFLHELATNAAKHGALSSPNGCVEVRWSLQDGELRLVWKESGGPALDGPPTREGFGSLLARRSIEGQLGATLSHEWNSDGLVVGLTVSAERLLQ